MEQKFQEFDQGEFISPVAGIPFHSWLIGLFRIHCSLLKMGFGRRHHKFRKVGTKEGFAIMTQKFAEVMFTPSIKEIQEQHGSRKAYSRLESSGITTKDSLSHNEAEFIAARDSCYIATVSETGWPYIQHRGGPIGFVKILDAHSIGFADYRGNRQYISVGNIVGDDRVSMFFMDYPNRRRLKLQGHARSVYEATDPILISQLRDAYGAVIERGIVIEVEAFDWNCPQHITPRFSETEIAAIVSMSESSAD